VARRKQPPHERQTRLGVILAIVGVASVALLTVCIFWRFDFGDFVALYRTGSPRFFILAGSLVVALGAGTGGFFLSLNAAGQKRNEKAALAWKAFFINAIVIALTLCEGIIFFFAKQSVS